MAYATLTQVGQFMEDLALPRFPAQVTLGVASRLVAGKVDAPDPVTNDFITAARDAELLVFRYIWRTEAFKTGERSVVGSSISYDRDPQVLKIVHDNLGEWLKPGLGGGDDGKAYSSRSKNL
jgi:hypothetical protein